MGRSTMSPIAEHHRHVNSGMLWDQQFTGQGVQNEEMDAEFLKDVVRTWLAKLVEDKCAGNQSEFARQTGIKQADLNRALNKKGRGVSWTMLARIANSDGYPALNEILGEIAKRAADAQTEAIIKGENVKTPREKLKEKFSSAELQRRARAARAAQRREQPERPRPSIEAPVPKKHDRG